MYGPSRTSAAGNFASNQALIDQVEKNVAAYRQENGLSADQKVPVDAVTADFSGLDPNIGEAGEGAISRRRPRPRSGTVGLR
jgi:potassium-transporting ATPase KdpC subunit